MGTRKLLMEYVPNDWYIDDTGVFQEHGRHETGVQDTIVCKESTLVGILSWS
ncbi:hypothetical protein FOC1_g10016010 [Fusarium oxysporum f. sp. cubense race 1]|uniref:Uncharacterized protein n=1 Tax=Fusarium oxysporum f. sp. cubense (strain race 1) TaxID=1229664 RepID=N4TX84_FUSC1|nr:hypothetical protein FOC1_g10016010 [Fusarium oxysporum f. sp. cubense race 1]